MFSFLLRLNVDLDDEAIGEESKRVIVHVTFSKCQ